MGTTPRQLVVLERLKAFADFVDVQPAEHPGRWRERFAARIGSAFDDRLVVEIGCADGDLLARVASKHPRTAFVGIDWKYGDILRAAERIVAMELRNVCFVRGRAQDLPQTFSERECDELWLFHPDPCATVVERPNRLFAEPFLLSAASVLRNDQSTLTLKTDHAGYFQAALAVLGVPAPDWPTLTPRVRVRDLEPIDTLPPASGAARQLFKVDFVATDFTGNAAAQSRALTRAFAGEQTAYEAKFVAKRQPIFYVELRRRASTTIAPWIP